jgi:hypothetical protein
LADIVFDVGSIVITIITIAAMFNSTVVYNKIIENNSDKFLELAAKYEQCIYEKHSVKDIASQVLNLYDSSLGLYGFPPGSGLSRDPWISSCKLLIEEIKDDPVIKELYSIRISKELASIFLTLFLIAYVLSKHIVVSLQIKITK